MKALVFEKSGLESLELREVPNPSVGDTDVRIAVKMASVNPVDIMSVESLKVYPIPHIPGSEFFGVVEEVGKKVSHVSPGDRVAVYTRLFDGTCRSCLRGDQTYCKAGKRIGVESQGGYAEEIVVPGTNVVRSDLPDEILASLPIAMLTPYHALKSAGVSSSDVVVVVGASGNTGMFAVQLGKLLGATVIAISAKPWVKELGADYVLDYQEAEEAVREITFGDMASVVVNSLGGKYWDLSLRLLGNHGRLVTFGSLTGGNVNLNINDIYLKHASIIGTNRGSMGDLMELLKIAGKLQVRTWKVFPLEQGRFAMEQFKSSDRKGRIFIRIN
ncbi:alcohol dehydrogenase catalytic domain-containing protein [Metallosphaera tengchongensis]|uniref:Alcohol dehydrogenase catalytic domain-containing protein n=1 Tax=Metallosphaera tengchongensis TaxID=1532350 RepID=A0A6N0NTF6_9CREN|nr:alcohol dehydrogenase catalytic domain-containing protein [Metallosphaera tengchongensis]QKR00144.1 alcohol dehydrogenase catalytic domain-containing protein [Metallosphaera tengchongensis]